MGQGTTKQLTNLRRILHHTLYEIFHPLEAEDSPSRKEPASVKKVLQGDAYWLGYSKGNPCMDYRYDEQDDNRIATSPH